jgi:PIN domain nuclease of toxin-antitoxin system
MKFLLDTHILLWSLLEPEKLNKNVQDCLNETSNQLWLSPITTWEIIVLAEKERIQLRSTNVENWIKSVYATIPFKEAFLNHEVVIQSRKMDLPHQDPADRFIAASAYVYDLTLITSDRKLKNLENIKIFPN